MNSSRGQKSNTATSARSVASSSNNNRTTSPYRHAGAGTWMKTHPLEGDGLITGFYHFLHKRNTKTMKACVDVLIPDTIVYDHNFPRGWYTTDMKSREIMKRQGKELDSATILKHFEEPPCKNVGIVASYMSCTEEDDITTTHVEFFNQNTLKEFVERKTKREGILQKFVVPKGGTRNTVIQAVWSPRVLCVWRRQNRNHLDNTSQSSRDPYPIAVTYDGPSHYSEESTCASNTTEEIKGICSNIVRHFYQTMEHKFLTRMVLYFKVDEHDQVWLMWCGSLRVADKDRLDPVTLNFAPRNDNPTQEAAKESWENEKLHEMDERYVHIGNDALFKSRYLESSGRHGSHSPHHTARGGAHGASSSSGYGTRSTMLGSLQGTGGSSGGPGRNGNKNSSDKQGGAAADASTVDDGSWHRNPQIHDAYVELCTAREKVLSHLDDIFYEAYGHFLRYDPGPFNFAVEKGVARLLGYDSLGEAMLAGGVLKATPNTESTAENINDDDDLCFEILAKDKLHSQGPIAKTSDAVKDWVNKHYDKLILDLKEEAASILPPTTVSAEALRAGAATNTNDTTAQRTTTNSNNATADKTETQEQQQQPIAASEQTTAPVAAPGTPPAEEKTEVTAAVDDYKKPEPEPEDKKDASYEADDFEEEL